MMLPPYRKSVVIKFSSLRNTVGETLGVCFDMDTVVMREAYRTRTPQGWKWQIKGYRKLMEWDHSAITDQEILDEYGSGIEVQISYEEVGNERREG